MHDTDHGPVHFSLQAKGQYFLRILVRQLCRISEPCPPPGEYTINDLGSEGPPTLALSIEHWGTPYYGTIIEEHWGIPYYDTIERWGTL